LRDRNHARKVYMLESDLNGQGVLLAVKSVKCRVCGAENPPGTEYCDSCGVKLEATSGKSEGEMDKLLEELIDVAPAEEAAASAKAAKESEAEKELVDELLDSLLIEEGAAPSEEFECPLCGTQLPVNAEVCAHCGARFAKVPAKEEEEADAEAKATTPEAEQEAVKPVSVSVTEEDVTKMKVSHGRLIDITVIGTLLAALLIFAVGGLYDSSKVSDSPAILAAFIIVVFAGTFVGYMLLQISSSATAQGDKLVKEGNYQDALYYYDRAIRMGTKPASAWTSKGVALKRLSKYEEALHCHNVALKLDPDNEIAWCNKGDIYFRMGDLKKAILCFDKAIELKPKYAIAWNNKGAALAMSKNFNEAKKCHDMAVKLKPKYMAAWLNRGEVLAKLGMRDEAVKCLERAKSLGA